jgi:hypothetical protein
MSNIKTFALHVMDKATWCDKMQHVFQDFFDSAKAETFDEEYAALTASHVADHPQYQELFDYVQKNILPDRECFCKAWLDRGLRE